MLKNLSVNDNFEEVLKDGVWLVDFYATWCGPCKMLGPVLEEFSSNHNVLKVDGDQFNELASRFGIMSVPTLIVFKNGQLEKTTMGYKTIDELNEFIK